MRTAVYVIGPPGVGKSSLVAALLSATRAIPQVGTEHVPFAHTLHVDHVGGAVAWQPGAAHEHFPGTDRLSMGVQPKAIAALPHMLWAGHLVAEGDRLATRGFLDALTVHYDHVHVVRLWADDATCAARRAARAGSAPKDAWLRGRVTKVENLVRWWMEQHVMPERDRVHAEARVDVMPGLYATGFSMINTDTMTPAEAVATLVTVQPELRRLSTVSPR